MARYKMTINTDTYKLNVEDAVKRIGNQEHGMII